MTIPPATAAPITPTSERTHPALLQQDLRRRLEALGFDDVRFAAVAGPLRDPLRAWLSSGMHADMQWMERSADKRLNPELVLPGARSLILLGVNYWSENLRHATRSKPPGVLRSPDAAAGPSASPAAKSLTPTWARYALHEDYHDTFKPALVAAGRVLEELFGATSQDYRYYVDTGPVLERSWATRAGIGFTGKNAMLISRRYGNWLFLASILTRIDFSPDAPIRKTVTSPRPAPQPRASTAPPPVAAAEPATSLPASADARDDVPAAASPPRVETSAVTPGESASPVGLLCGHCTRCLDACPTNAFAAPGVVDARRCISYQTIENKGVIPLELRPGIGHRIYGCDVCLDVCPWNRFAREGRKLLLAARYDLADLTLAEILALTPERFAEVFRRTPIKRLKLTGLLRNACIVAGNVGDESILPQLLHLASEHASPLVRAHAVWAVSRLRGMEKLAAARAREVDPIVLAEYASAAG